MDIRNPRLLYLKGILFLVAGALAATGILLEHPSLKIALLLAVCVWCFARAYYFAFYVVQHYVDPSFHFAGLGAFMKYLILRRRSNGMDEGRPAGKGPEGR